ncbi:hypothetical protein ACJMK2_004416 [Sinanodonta woodiana]|uniref:C-terminal of Roc (COR) domain-containing protein n=1 Tax=Sinanodonta woodiana TaxID=1069815 RepID=A0ABD3Y1Q6_SINWO
MGESFQKLYRDALSTGNEKDYSIRVMIVGHQGVGKTSLTQRLLGQKVTENETESTEGIDVHTRCCQIDHATGEWKRNIRRDELFLNDQRIASIVQKYKGPQDHRDLNVTGAENDTFPAKKRRLSQPDQTAVPLSLDTGSGNSVKDPSVSRITNEANNLTETDSAVTNMLLDCKGQTGNELDESERGTDTTEIQTFLDRAPSLIIPKRMSSDVTLLDFAGQSLFYTTHQAFMSWRTIYLLVTDMSLPLTDVVQEGEYGIDNSGSKTCSIQDNISYWLNSVHSHVCIPEDHRIRKEVKKPRTDESSGMVQAPTVKHPFVILVGTHADRIPKDLLEKRKKSYFNDIRNHLKNSPLMLHLVDEDFAISNLGSDLNINVLKSKIFEIAQKHVCWGTNIPARWIPLEKALMKLKNEGIPVMDYSDVKRINESRQVKLESPEEFDLFLMFEHDIGNIVFFPTERLRKNVVLDPEWLIRGVRIWITSDQVTTRHPELSEQWHAFKDTGLLTSTLIEKLWSSHFEIHQHREHLLDVMEELNIIAKPLKLTEEQYYWVPCMVSVHAPDDVKKLQQNKDTTKTSTLCFRSKTNFIHVGVFHRLLATGLSKWEPVKDGNKYLLFRGLCVFDLDNQHQLILSLNDCVIHATVIRFTNKGRIPDLTLCMTIRDILNSALSEISDCLCPGSEFEICIKCKESSPMSNEGLHSITTLRANDELKCSTHTCKEAHCVESVNLLGFWEENQKQIPPNVVPLQRQARERFTRVSSLLLDVGTKVLRKVLIYYTTTSLCTLDQYMKKNKPDILDLNKKKVLTNTQVDIIFPSIGQTKIRKYDITLASVLLNNIYPSLCPQEKKMITDLRTERNNLAHSHSTMMKEQEFQTKWTHIINLLTDLSKLCNDPNFDSEIQKEIQDI